MSSRNLLGFGSTRSAGGAAVVPVTVDTNPHNASASWIEQSGSSDAADSRRPAMLKRQTAQPGRIVGKPPPLHLSAAAEGGSSAGASPASVGSVRSLPRLGLSRFRAVAQAVIASRKKPSKVHRKQLRKNFNSKLHEEREAAHEWQRQHDALMMSEDEDDEEDEDDNSDDGSASAGSGNVSPMARELGIALAVAHARAERSADAVEGDVLPGRRGSISTDALEAEVESLLRPPPARRVPGVSLLETATYSTASLSHVALEGSADASLQLDTGRSDGATAGADAGAGMNRARMMPPRLGQSASSRSLRGPGLRGPSMRSSPALSHLKKRNTNLSTRSLGAIPHMGSTRSLTALAELARARNRNIAQRYALPTETPVAGRPRFSMTSRCAYRLDKLLSRRGGKVIAIVLITALLLLLAAVLIECGRALQGQRMGSTFADSLWSGWGFITDPGTHADETGWSNRLAGATVTVGGIMLSAVVIAFVVDGVRQRLDSLKQGRTMVVESNHYLVVGWSDKSFALIQELCLAMHSEGGGVVVVLSETDKLQLENEIRSHFSLGDLLGTDIICRQGSGLLLSDLKKVSAEYARAIILLSQGGDANKADTAALRTVLSVTSLKRRPRGHLVTEMRDLDNQGLVEIVGRGMVETLVGHDIIGRLMVKCARQRGLADVYETCLGFAGDEFYLQEWPELVGSRWQYLTFKFPDAVPVGVKTNGRVLLNPLDSYIIQPGDELLVLAEDDDSYAPSNMKLVPDPGRGPSFAIPRPEPERVLMCGWRRDVEDIVLLLDSMVCPGSELHILSEMPISERNTRLEYAQVDLSSLNNLTVQHRVGNPALRRVLDSLPLETYTSQIDLQILV